MRAPKCRLCGKEHWGSVCPNYHDRQIMAEQKERESVAKKPVKQSKAKKAAKRPPARKEAPVVKPPHQRFRSSLDKRVPLDKKKPNKIVTGLKEAVASAKRKLDRETAPEKAEVTQFVGVRLPASTVDAMDKKALADSTNRSEIIKAGLAKVLK